MSFFKTTLAGIVLNYWHMFYYYSSFNKRALSLPTLPDFQVYANG